jgi:type IV pilus assembly protein PilX
MREQQGITLFIVIIVLVLVTSLAAAVITETRLGQSAIGLIQEKLAGEQEILSGVESIISDSGLVNVIMGMRVDDSINMSADLFHTQASITLRDETYCKRSESASSINIINCRNVRIDFNQQSGTRRVQGNRITSGIEQPFLAAKNN